MAMKTMRTVFTRTLVFLIIMVAIMCWLCSGCSRSVPSFVEGQLLLTKAWVSLNADGTCSSGYGYVKYWKFYDGNASPQDEASALSTPYHSGVP